MNKEIYKKLTKRIIPQWRVQNGNISYALCVAYINSRDVQQILDDAVGWENWQCKYRQIGEIMFCSISIYDKEKQMWISKEDCGTESNTEKEKGEASDSFKRAAVKFGVGRFLYTIGRQYLKSKKITITKKGKPEDKYVPIDENGNIIKDYELTDYINNKIDKEKSIQLQIIKKENIIDLDTFFSKCKEKYNAENRHEISLNEIKELYTLLKKEKNKNKINNSKEGK